MGYFQLRFGSRRSQYIYLIFIFYYTCARVIFGILLRMQQKGFVEKWLCRGRMMDLRHPVVMAILNVTPDSFLSTSRVEEVSAAVARGCAFFAAGAGIVDIGGESTRPGAEAVSPEVEKARVLPVIRGLRAACPTGFISIDTRHAAVAVAAVEAGADIINHVEGCSAPDEMTAILRTTGAGYVLMHSRGNPKTMDGLTEYADLVAEVTAELETAAKRLEAAGILREQICLDPGLGFAKTAEGSRMLLHEVKRLAALPYPCLIGASRKRFLGGDGPETRLEASLDAAVTAVSGGAQIVRVHDVPETVSRLKHFQETQTGVEKVNV